MEENTAMVKPKKRPKKARSADRVKVESVIEDLMKIRRSVNGGIEAFRDTKHKELVASWAGESRGLFTAVRELRKRFPDGK